MRALRAWKTQSFLLRYARASEDRYGQQCISLECWISGLFLFLARLMASLLEDAMAWHPFFRIDEDFAKAGEIPVAAIARNPDHMDLFVTGNDGRIYNTYWDPAPGWGIWSPIDDGFTKGASAATAVARNPDHVDLFVTGNGGRVYSTWWDSATGWGPWFEIDNDFAKGASAVTVVARNPDHMDLFVTGNDGRIYNTYWDPAPGWGIWSPIDNDFAKGASAVTVVARNPDHLDLFVTGNDGRIYSTWWDSATGWGPWFRIDYLFPNGVSAVTAVARNPDDMDLFVTGNDEGIYSTYWDPSPPLLRQVKITFDTHDDNKNDSTIVHVFVKNRLNNSLSPEQNTDFISNWLAFQRYQVNGDVSDGERNPYLASKLSLGRNDAFDEGSSRTFTLDLSSEDISVNDIVLPVVNIHMLAAWDLGGGYDQWIFDYTVTLTFDSGEFSFTSAVDGVRGIILDQDNRNHSGFGIENPLRTVPLPVLTKAATNAILKKVTLEFSTHHDNKNADTRLNVHIVNRISATLAQDIAIGLDLFHDQEFPDSGPPADLYRKFSWASDEGTLISNTIRLADMVLPVVNIVIVPNDDDRWIFDYRVTFEFEDAQDFGQKRRIYSSRTNGIILDQDNNKHSGVYQGRSFPTVAPPTAPQLTIQPVDHTGDRQKTISIPFLQRKFEEFINGRNGPDTSLNPPLRKIHLGSTPGHSSQDPLPESYVDVQSILAGGDGNVHYVSGPTSLGQMKQDWGFANTYLDNIDSDSVRLDVEASQATPLTLTVDFKPGGTLYIMNFGTITLDRFSISLKLTLDKATIVNQFDVSHTVADVLSWVTELQNMTVLPHPVGHRYKGTFLHQPVDLLSSESINDLFVEQVIKVSLVTDSPFNPGKIIRTTIRDHIYSALITPDVITGTTPRDSFNSLVTSWLLGGVADDVLNTDQNNAVIHGIGILNKNPELGIPEDMIALDYSGPNFVFEPPAPVDWPTPGQPGATYDFSPGALAHIKHIVVLTKENRSFDHMLGYLSLPVEQGGMGRQEVDGLKGDEFNPYQGKNFPSLQLTETRFAPGPPNGYESVHHAINGGKMDGFVRSHAEANSDEVAGQVMGYHTGATVPVYDALARDFAIGHRWFASHPGPTFPNRFYELTGRPNLDPSGFWEFENSSPLRPVFTPTIFDYLKGAVDPISGAPVTWRYFEYGYCSLRFFEQYTFDHENIVGFDDPEDGFFARARTGQLPSVSFIDPHFVDYPPGSNCDEPPSDIADGQVLVQRIVEAVIASPAWHETLLLIIYDEHGGFYDHVPPPAAARVSDEFPISTLGLRVPAFVISPWVTPGSVFGYDDDATNPVPPSTSSGATSIARESTGIGRDLHFDHTSILKTIARRFLSENPPYMGARYAVANDLSAVIGTYLRQPQFLPFIPYRLQSVQSQMMLDVKLAGRAPGTVLWQFPGNGTVAQDFSFEDAGGGFVYIRSYVSNLYVTVQVPDFVLSGGTTGSSGVMASAGKTTSVGTSDAPPRAGNAGGPGLIQDVKYPPSQVIVIGARRPELQKWKLSSVSVSILDRNLYVISNQAYPDMLLQPANSSQSQSPIVLGEAGASAGIHDRHPNAWKVSSPLFSDELVSTQ
jgi:hypothetical protein